MNAGKHKSLIALIALVILSSFCVAHAASLDDVVLYKFARMKKQYIEVKKIARGVYNGERVGECILNGIDISRFCEKGYPCEIECTLDTSADEFVVDDDGIERKVIDIFSAKKFSPTTVKMKLSEIFLSESSETSYVAGTDIVTGKKMTIYIAPNLIPYEYDRDGNPHMNSRAKVGQVRQVSFSPVEVIDAKTGREEFSYPTLISIGR